MNDTLNPQLTSQFDSIWGTKTPATSSAGTPMTSRADEIRAIGKQSQPDDTSGFHEDNGTYKYGDTTIVGGPAAAAIKSVAVEPGKDIAAAIGGSSYIDKLSQLHKADQDTLTMFVQKRNEAQKTGDQKTTDHFQNLINNYKTTDGQSATDLFPALAKTNEQVAGDFVNLGAGLLSGGGLESAGEAIASKSAGELAATGAKIGTGFGAAGGAANAMTNNASATDVLKQGVEGAAVGGATGGILGGATGIASNALNSVSDKLASGTSEGVVNDLQNYIAKKNVPENLGSTVDSLKTAPNQEPSIKGADGKPTQATAKTIDPLKTYDDFYAQEQKFKGNVKEDTALGKVGERIGNSYDKVIGMRRDVGKTMETELGKIGDTKTDVSSSFPKFETELQKSGITYDVEKGGVIPSSTNKMTGQDRGMINTYIGELNKLVQKKSRASLETLEESYKESMRILGRSLF